MPQGPIMKLLQNLSILCTFLVAGSSAASLHRNRETRLGEALAVKEPIDPAKKYHLGWTVDEEKQEIVFEIEAETKAYIGFGLSPSGGMTGADIFIAGVKDDGTLYSGDYHGTMNGPPTIDTQQDWMLLEAMENATHTIIKVSRALDTCDPEDFPINGDSSRVIWSIGQNDEITHHADRGTTTANFLIPEQPFDPSKYQNFTTMIDMVMPSHDTSYWCSLHKGQAFDKKHHVVGFEAFLPTPDAEAYTHHFLLYSCTAPDGEDPDEFFGKWLPEEGEENGGHCYAEGEDALPFHGYCGVGQEVIFVWAKGGKRMVLPEEIGYPIGETPLTPYYMLEVHYDNPKMEAGKKFATGLRTFYTSELRPVEAGLLIVGHRTNPSIVVPPETKDFVVAGHCASECTQAKFPEEGIQIFNSLLHAHLSGRQLKLRQFRNGEELPWVDNDGLYDFNFQQNKPLTNFVRVMPGDQLTYECVYDSTWNEKKEAVTGGLSSRDEMCEGFFWYHPKVDMTGCYSSYPLEQGLRDFGITEYHEETSGGISKVIIEKPDNMAGPYVDGISFKFEWTEEFLQEFQEKRRFGEHEFSCRGGISGVVKYPEVRQEYVPEDKCSETGTTTPESSTSSESNTTPERITTPEGNTTPERTTTPERNTTPERTTTPGSNTTPERTTTPESNTTPERTTTPESNTTPERTTTPDSNTTPEVTTTPESSTSLGTITSPNVLSVGVFLTLLIKFI